MRTLSVIVRPPGGQAQQFSTELDKGVVPEQYTDRHDEHGALHCSFVLRRKPEVDWPDLSPYSPLWALVDGQLAFQGRIAETPTSRGGAEDTVNVIGEGWQMHLTDDAPNRLYIDTDVTKWTDWRQNVFADLTQFTSEPTITVGNVLQLSVPKGTIINTVTGGRSCNLGVVYDAGPGRTIRTVTIRKRHSSLAAASVGGTFEIRCIGGDGANGLAQSSDFFNIALSGAAADGTGTVVTGSFAADHRLVLIAFVNAAAATTTAEIWLQLDQISMFSATSYQTAGVSNLVASTIIKDTLTYCPLVSADQSRVQTPSFVIPHWVGQRDAPKAYIDGVNAFHLWQWFLDLGDGALGLPRMVFRPVPTAPVLVANIKTKGITWDNTSRNDGSQIYNRCVVEYTDAAGNPAETVRQTPSTGLPYIFDPAVQPTNPSFTVDTSSWTAVTGTITRDTVTFDTTPASLRLTSAASGTAIATTSVFTGSFVQGRTYQIRVRARALAGVVDPAIFLYITTVGGSTYYGSTISNLTTSFADYTVTFAAPVGSVLLTVRASSSNTFAADVAYIDSLEVRRAYPTVLDRLGQIRTKVLATNARLTAAAANQIGDTFLLAHKSTPLSGVITATGPALSMYQTGEQVAPHQVARHIGDAILLADEVDPDTGALGRVGIIAGIDFDHANDKASIAIDNRKDFLDGLLARFASYQS